MTDHVDPRIEPAARALYEYDRNASCSPDRWPDWDSPDNNGREIGRDMATAALAAADKAATITTVEELDALPIESVILDCEGYPYRRVRQYPDVPSSWEGYELGEHLDVDTIDFPARVIHWGTE